MEGDDEIRGLRYEYVLQIDGKFKSAYRRFVDALRAGLELKQVYPQSNIKVCDANEQSTTESRQRIISAA
jgi:hypothetical protein